jgi:hypothetical protein
MRYEEFQTCLAQLPGPPYLEDFEAAAFALYRAGTREQRAVLLEMRRRIPESDRLTPERRISRALRFALERIGNGAGFLDASEHRGLLLGLEFFIPATLSNKYPYWNHESLDGFFLSKAEKVDAETAQLVGVCILISDQTVTPFEAKLKVSSLEEKIDWMECRVGQRSKGNGDMERTPHSRWRHNPLIGMENSKEPIDWVYTIALDPRDNR